MTLPGGPFFIFEDRKLKLGIYKIWNLYSQNYLDILKHSREVCCHPAGDLGDRGLCICFCDLDLLLMIRSGK